jgi:hypothetical protein
MTKSKASTANFLPIIAIAILIAAAGFLLTKDDLDLPWMPSNKVSATHLVNFPREVPTLQELVKDRKVLKSQDELNNYLKTIDPTGSTRVEENIDFNRYYVVAVNTETLIEDGYKMKIRRIYEDKDENELKVMILLTEPGDTCETQDVTNVVVDMVKVKKTDMKFSFGREKQTKECGDKEADSEDKESTPSDQ